MSDRKFRLEVAAAKVFMQAWVKTYPHVLNAAYLLRHKLYVYRAGRRLGVSTWRLLKHDLSKLHPDEWFPYTEHFYGAGAGPNRSGGGESPAFRAAFFRHVSNNDHHPEYWYGPDDAWEMDEQAARELVADWWAAGKARGNADPRGWYEKTRDRFVFHPKTRELVEKLLLEVDAWKN